MAKVIEVLPNDAQNAKLVANTHPADWRNPTPRGAYNLVVIGGGSAGLVAAAGAAGLGAKVALIERHLLGGDCLNTGCVPSKSVIRTAKVLGEIQRAQEYGIAVPAPVKVDFAAVMARMRTVRADLSEHDSVYRFQKLGVDVYLGDGQFTGERSLEVGGQTLNFKQALLATGSRAATPSIAGLAESGFLTNESVFSLAELPRRLAVIGGGPIGCELAHAFRRFGSEVTIFNTHRTLLPREEVDAAAVIQAQFVHEGIELRLGANVVEVVRTPSGKCLHYEQAGQHASLEVDEILVAVGRAPNVEGLNLEVAGVVYDKQGIQVNDALQSTNPNIYAAGDVGLMYQFTHAADASARMVLRNALFPGPKQKVSDLIMPWCTYTDPEVAHVGRYEREAQAQGIATTSFTHSIGEVDRGRTDGETTGFVRVLVRKGSDKILGVTIVASHAGEMINELTLAMQNGVGLKQLAYVIHPYPTQAEAIKKVADAYLRTRLTPLTKRILDAYMAWRR